MHQEQELKGTRVLPCSAPPYFYPFREKRSPEEGQRERSNGTLHALGSVLQTKKGVPNSDKTGLIRHQLHGAALYGFACMQLLSTYAGKDNMHEARTRS